MKIRKILIANRGEIALRIMRTAREMGISTVAVFSEADSTALHVRYADEAVPVGPPPAAQSYLDMDRLIEAALQTQCDAIHPGYGFLSENPVFAQRVADAGIIFIGPPAAAMSLMGSKLAAKDTVSKHGVPLVPGTSTPITDTADAKRIASDIGYPILIKASAGGGGKGMRIVSAASEFEEQMDRAVSEATSAFGDGAVFIEKYVTKPRHIEIQIIGDQQGNMVYLAERECSIQRRHQKVVEEAPSSILDDEKRKAMGEAAIAVARSCGYYSAGTVEFLMDEALNFYFLEMNTRLQVEHPVTEAVTGLDLVRLQIMVAEGHSLPFSQDDVTIRGHAIEVRVYAEDPANGFLPDTGMLKTYRRPQGPGIRVDDGFEQGMTVPFYYDPMIAKLVAHAHDREAAIARMIRAIDEYEVTGIETTLHFCRFVMLHPAFQSGQFDTHFIENYFKPESLRQSLDDDEAVVAAAFATQLSAQPQPTNNRPKQANGAVASKWRKSRQ
jgi:propionyl-CoA carboxylase alpha chain